MMQGTHPQTTEAKEHVILIHNLPHNILKKIQ